MIPRWGVLYNIYDNLTNKYSGRVFIRKGATGHLFCQHYMQVMFPLRGHGDHSFLHRVVTVDNQIVADRDKEARKEFTHLRKQSQDSPIHSPHSDDAAHNRIDTSLASPDHPETSNGSYVHARAQGYRNGMVEFVDSTEEGEGANGRTVAELSRLWRYIGGNVPS